MSQQNLNNSDVQKVSTWTADQFAQWLTTEIPQSLPGANARYPFRPLHYLFVPSLPTWEVMWHISVAMDSRCRAEFFEGISRAIDLLVPTSEGYDTFEVLLQIVGGTNCVQACDAIVRKVGNQAFGAPTFQRASDAYALALATIAGLVPTIHSQVALENLASSDWFLPQYAPTVLVALARHNRHIPKHLDILKGKFGTVDIESTRIQEMLHELTAILPFAEFDRQWRDLLLHSEKWLFEGLVLMSMTISENADGFRLEKGDGRAINLPLDLEDPKTEARLVQAISTIMDKQLLENATPELMELLPA